MESIRINIRFSVPHSFNTLSSCLCTPLDVQWKKKPYATGIIPKALSRAERPGIMLLTDGTELRPEFQTISMSTLHFPFYVLDVAVLKEPSQAQRALDKKNATAAAAASSKGGGGAPKKAPTPTWRYLPSFNELRASGRGLLKASEDIVPFMLWYFEEQQQEQGEDSSSSSSSAGTAKPPASASIGRSVRRDEIAFISHRWLHPVAEAGKVGARPAHPDDTKGSKLKFLQVRELLVPKEVLLYYIRVWEINEKQICASLFI